jgi:hypothetical protein
MSEFEQPDKGISRRTVTKTIAWAVPAIAIAAPVPAFAGASQGTISLTGDGCKLPGNSSAPYSTNGAVYLLTITNTTNAPSTVTVTDVTRTGSAKGPGFNFSLVRITGSGTCCTQLGKTVTVNAKSSDTFALVTGGWDNSSNGQIAVSYNIGIDPQTPATTTPNSLNPITPAGPCNIGGSCSINDAYSKCILAAIGVAGCASGCL